MHEFSDHISQATTVAELEHANRLIDEWVQESAKAGAEVRTLAQTVSDLNRQLLGRLYELLATPAMVANTCLLVMGSEGRAEQILKTDQDNALIIRDTFADTQLAAVAGEFTKTLTTFGYPLCPGNIMVSNADWRQPLDLFRRSIYRWTDQPEGLSLLHLAIFCDAQAVAGDEGLLVELREMLFARLHSKPAFLSHFAGIALTFPTPLGWLSRFKLDRQRQALDIKKGGVFPIVHGVRSLALERKITATNTFERIEALTASGLLTTDYAQTLSATLTELSRLRLNAGLARLAAGESIDNWIAPAQLSRAEQDRLHQCLKFVEQFKQLIMHHFKLKLLGF